MATSQELLEKYKLEASRTLDDAAPSAPPLPEAPSSSSSRPTLTCPITLCSFKDPVLLIGDGHTYHKFPLHRAAMRGDVGEIDRLIAAGVDPNGKMGEWFDSEPLGWAASFGELEAVRALILGGASPLRPANKAGYTPLTDAERERHVAVVDFLKAYRDMCKSKGYAATLPSTTENGFRKYKITSLSNVSST